MPEPRLPQDDALHVRVLRAALEPIAPESWAWHALCSTYWRLYYDDQNGAEVRIDENAYPLRAGRVYLVPAGVTFSCVCHEPLQHLFVHFDVVSMPAGLVRDLLPSVIELGRDPALETALAQLQGGLRRQPLATLAELCLVKAALYQALSLMFRDLAPVKLARCMSVVHATNPVTGALHFIEDNLALAIENRGLARACGLSESHFIRTFRAVMGQTPAQYILDRRVAQAAHRLLYTKGSIEQIADACGFPNRSYFTRVFTRRSGTPPAAFRRKGAGTLGSASQQASDAA